jgi:hypothetical protein
VASRGNGRRWRERRFSRRDAVSASANTGRAQTGGGHDHGRARERLVAKRRRHMGWRDPFPYGRAEPAPPRGGLAQHGWPSGGRSEMTGKAVFSEGRGLRVRIAMRCASRGTSSLSTSWPEAGCLAGTCLGEARAFPAGVRSPPLRGPGRPRGEPGLQKGETPR